MRWTILFLVAINLHAAADPSPGGKLYSLHCAQCHDASNPGRIPPRATLEQMTTSMIMTALTSGVMQQQAKSLSPQDKQAVADFLGKAPAAQLPATALTHPCPARTRPNPAIGPGWTSWGVTEMNTRFQPAGQAQLSASDVPKLKLRWAFGVPNATVMRSQPVVAGGRIYIGGDNSTVYALDASTGCEYWATSTRQVRTGLVMGKVGESQTIFFGDVAGNVTALNSESGALLWQVHVGDHENALVTGTPAYARGRLYVPVSSYEELAAIFPNHECCTFRGSVVSLNADNGAQLWRVHTITESAHLQRTSDDKRKLLGPSGAAVWSTPTIDSAKGRLYFTTGDNYSDPTTQTSDSLFAVDLQTGRLLWSRQFTKDDAFNMSCGEAGKGNCPQSRGADLDFGSPPILFMLPSGRRALLLAQKSGMVYAVDPGAEGAILWKAKAADGGALGGIQWGAAIDGSTAYAAISDFRLLKSDTPGKLMPDPKKGGGLHAYRLSDGKLLWSAPASDCGQRQPCSPAQSAPVTAIAGVVFSGSLDGHLRAYDSSNGRVIWDFDTARSFETVNKVAAKGGSLDVAGPVIAGGTVFAVSGYSQYGGAPGNVLLAFSAN